ncbi:MAG TPA: flagellar basal body P-ring formation chaperone FlgA [Candidatus Limnocylindria bacterium]|jgi:flagella basal body P-ring formation protein FlgA|nr:flagellar basal body P-ring formation chaperone FlgA [Candidatus Limnocylindria bacterium]
MNRFFLYPILFLALLCALPRTALNAGAGEPACSLRTEVQVSGTGVFLRDLLEDADYFPNPRLADAPTVGKPLVLTRSNIVALLPRTNSLPALTNWLGAEAIRVARRTRTLEQAELLELITGVLQREQVRERGELELRFGPGRAWAPAVVPDDPFVLSVQELPANGISGNFLLRFELRLGRESFGLWTVPLQAKLWRDVLVAGSVLRRGQPLADADVTHQRTDLLVHRDALVTLPPDASYLDLGETLQPGTVLTFNSLRRRPLVYRGKVVEATVQSGLMEISVKAEALEDGVSGQYIRVRNLNSKREFRGKVQNENSVVIVL